jgi:3',5'-cyclic AMP phosphodiesterase CpdA
VAREAFVIAQLSDLHCGSPYFDGELLSAGVKEVIALDPDLVVVGGDLTAEGYAHEFRDAQRHLDPLFEAGLNTLVVPGNHDSKNVGYLHFADTFGVGDTGKGDRVIRINFAGAAQERPMAISVVAIDSSKPDLAEGEVGHTKYEWIRDSYQWVEDYRVFVLHHHLVSVPGTGRERNIVWDAGDVLALLKELGVDLVLCGHKHVPNVWQLDEMLLINSGTAASGRGRGYTPPSYNVIEVDDERVRIVQRYPGVGEIVAANYDRGERRLSLNPQLEGMFNRGAWNV